MFIGDASDWCCGGGAQGDHFKTQVKQNSFDSSFPSMPYEWFNHQVLINFFYCQTLAPHHPTIKELLPTFCTHYIYVLTLRLDHLSFY